ncbi:MAG: negative transcriptional regulator [Hyphomicrobiales bacterium]|nr:MAG: negative transcriptional regulator [Hyphomicrobiales bacterium]
MHPNPVHRQTSEADMLTLARVRSFGILAVNHDDGPLLSHIPFTLSDDGTYLELHLVRSNPMLRLLENPVTAVIAVSCGDAYVSPDWYGIDDQVPTWNYVAVHLRGKLQRLENEALEGILRRLSDNMETRLLPKPVWTIDKMEPNALERLMRQIVPFRMSVDDISGTWKLSQNKDDDVRLGAAEGVASAGIGAETDRLAQMMRDASKPE